MSMEGPSTPATTIISLIFGGIVWLTGGPLWVCVIVFGLSYILIWTDEKISLVVGGIEQLLALQREVNQRLAFLVEEKADADDPEN